MEHQDWNQLVLGKRKKIPREVLREIPREISREIPKEVLREESDKPLKYIPKDLSRRIIEERIKQKWTQKQLAIASNVDISIVRQCENGTFIYNHILVNKIRKALKIL